MEEPEVELAAAPEGVHVEEGLGEPVAFPHFLFEGGLRLGEVEGEVEGVPDFGEEGPEV